MAYVLWTCVPWPKLSQAAITVTSIWMATLTDVRKGDWVSGSLAAGLLLAAFPPFRRRVNQRLTTFVEGVADAILLTTLVTGLTMLIKKAIIPQLPEDVFNSSRLSTLNKHVILPWILLVLISIYHLSYRRKMDVINHNPNTDTKRIWKHLQELEDNLSGEISRVLREVRNRLPDTDQIRIPTWPRGQVAEVPVEQYYLDKKSKSRKGDKIKRRKTRDENYTSEVEHGDDTEREMDMVSEAQSDFTKSDMGPIIPLDREKPVVDISAEVRTRKPRQPIKKCPHCGKAESIGHRCWVIEKRIRCFRCGERNHLAMFCSNSRAGALGVNMGGKVPLEHIRATMDKLQKQLDQASEEQHLREERIAEKRKAIGSDGLSSEEFNEMYRIRYGRDPPPTTVLVEGLPQVTQVYQEQNPFFSSAAPISTSGPVIACGVTYDQYGRLRKS